MPDIDDAESAFLSAKAEVSQWAEEFLREWNKPKVDTVARLFWNEQPEEIKAALRVSAPAAAAYLDKLLENSRR